MSLSVLGNLFTAVVSLVPQRERRASQSSVRRHLVCGNLPAPIPFKWKGHRYI